MNPISSHCTDRNVSIGISRALQLLAVIISLLALGTAIDGYQHARAEIGRPFGGFAWMKGHCDRYYVLPDTPHYWPGLQAGLHPLDVILAVNGQPPQALGDVYDANVGQSVTYEINRAGRHLHVVAPVVPFTTRMFLELHSVWLLGGLSALGAAYWLLRRMRDPPLVLMALFLLGTAVVQLNHVHGPHLHTDYPPTMLTDVLWAYSYPLMSALLWHFALIFPHPRQFLQARPELIWLIYGLALALGSLYLISIPPLMLTRPWEAWAYPAVLIALLSGFVASLVSGLLAYLTPPAGPDDIAHRRIRELTLAWLAGVILYSYLGIGLNLVAGWWTLVTDLLAPMVVIYPLLLVYAVRNMALVTELRQQALIAENTADELRELRALRERTLHEIADALHDTVISDVRGLQLWWASMRRQINSASDARLTEDLTFAGKALAQVYQNTRRIMEGIKPVDFAEEGLLTPLQRSLAHFRQANPTLEVRLTADTFDEDFPTAIKEDVYWIIQAALANSRDHAQAQVVTISMVKTTDHLRVMVRDDGIGFAATQAQGKQMPDLRRHLGLRNMQRRATRLNAELAIDSEPQGTTVSLVVPLAGGKDDGITARAHRRR